MSHFKAEVSRTVGKISERKQTVTRASPFWLKKIQCFSFKALFLELFVNINLVVLKTAVLIILYFTIRLNECGELLL